MVDTEPIVSKPDFCGPFGFHDTARISAAAMIQAHTIFGYHVNISQRVATYECREGQEEKEDSDSTLQTALKFVGSCVISSYSSNEIIFGRTIVNVMLTEWLGFSGFVISNSVPLLEYLW